MRLGLGLILILTFGVVFLIDRTTSVTPGPESQSAFLAGYDPAKVIQGFRDPAKPYANPRNLEASGSDGFVTSRLTYEPKFSLAAGKDGKGVLEALRNDARERLKTDGAAILTDRDDGPGGFLVGYQIGPVRGAIAAKMGDGAGAGETKLDIKVQEMWSEAASRQKKANRGS